MPAGLGWGAAGLGWQKGREISGSDGKVPPCGADTANVPPLSIRQDRRKPGCGGAGVEHGSRTTESATAPHLRVRRRSQFAGFAAILAPPGFVAILDSQTRRGICGTGEKVPPCHADRAETPPSRTKQGGGYPDTAGPEVARGYPNEAGRRDERGRTNSTGQGFTAAPAPQRWREKCRTVEKVPPWEADRAETPPSRRWRGTSPIGDEHNARRGTHDARCETRNARRETRDAQRTT